ncbi:MAG TPA: glycogen/starch synthase, partial [Spirochaetota bacterium]|nr:glycogen/starch synthase [Spirochaetota bacterium]
MDKKIKTLMVASESDKIAKIGGLADVVYSLSRELVNKGTDVAVIIPYYGAIDKKEESSDNIVFFKNFSNSFGGKEWKIKLYYKTVDNVRFYLVQNDFFFGGEYGKVYIDSEKLKNGPFEDDSK